MNIVQIYKQFPTQKACLKHLEAVRWNGKPKCTYCNSLRVTTTPKENRFHCNSCNTSFSVTVQTIFHKTKVDLQLWFLAIAIITNPKKGISARQLGRDLGVNKNTAWSMLIRIRKAEGSNLLQGIIKADTTYIGNKNRDNENVFSLIIERSVA
jgi:transposase-like protein